MIPLALSVYLSHCMCEFLLCAIESNLLPLLLVYGVTDCHIVHGQGSVRVVYSEFLRSSSVQHFGPTIGFTVMPIYFGAICTVGD